MGLSAGPGYCLAETQLAVLASRPVIELGAVVDVLHTVLNAAHHQNRHGDPDNRIAIALPEMHLHRGVARPGHEIVLFGSRTVLETFLELDGPRTLVRRQMIERPEIVEAWMDEGEPGTAYVRDRSIARRSPGALRRARSRAARRGVQLSATPAAQDPDPAALALHFGNAVVHVRAIEATLSTSPLRVSTYGMSSPGEPAVLPIQPNRSQAAGPADDNAA